MRLPPWRTGFWLLRECSDNLKKIAQDEKARAAKGKALKVIRGTHSTSMSADLGILEKALGHSFRDRELLERALTHKSKIYEKSAEGQTAADNEQLEFLGDAILGFAVSESLVRRFPAFPEGRLSKLKAHLVSATHLYAVAQSLQLGDYLLLGRGEEMSGGREKKALLSDAVEALIAALCLEAGLDVAAANSEEQRHWRLGSPRRRCRQCRNRS